MRARDESSLQFGRLPPSLDRLFFCRTRQEADDGEFKKRGKDETHRLQVLYTRF